MMQTGRRFSVFQIIWSSFLGLLLLALVGPLMIPVTPLRNIQPVEVLAFSDSRFMEVNGVDLHYREAGSGGPVFVLMHGFGASTYSFREVTQPLSALGRVIAYDRPAFGLTERPMRDDEEAWQDGSPYSTQAQVEQLIGLLDGLGVEQAVLVGNSAGGRVAVEAALAHPDRVQALILISPALDAVGFPGWIQWVFNTPQMRHIGPLISRSLAGPRGDEFIRSAWHNPALITSDVLIGYRAPLSMQNWDRALWEHTLAADRQSVVPRLGELEMPVLVITGDDDRIVETAATVANAEYFLGARLVVIPACGHLAHEECPVEFLKEVEGFVNDITN